MSALTARTQRRALTVNEARPREKRRVLTAAARRPLVFRIIAGNPS